MGSGSKPSGCSDDLEHARDGQDRALGDGGRDGDDVLHRDERPEDVHDSEQNRLMDLVR